MPRQCIAILETQLVVSLEPLSWKNPPPAGIFNRRTDPCLFLPPRTPPSPPPSRKKSKTVHQVFFRAINNKDNLFSCGPTPSMGTPCKPHPQHRSRVGERGRGRVGREQGSSSCSGGEGGTVQSTLGPKPTSRGTRLLFLGVFVSLVCFLLGIALLFLIASASFLQGFQSVRKVKESLMLANLSLVFRQDQGKRRTRSNQTPAINLVGSSAPRKKLAPYTRRRMK